MVPRSFTFQSLQKYFWLLSFIFNLRFQQEFRIAFSLYFPSILRVFSTYLEFPVKNAQFGPVNRFHASFTSVASCEEQLVRSIGYCKLLGYMS